MEATVASVHRRSTAWRVLLWSASLGLIGGGAYGAYYYASPILDEANASPGADTSAAESPSPAVGGDASPVEPATALAAPYASGDLIAERYAAPPTLPPAPDDEMTATPRSADVVQAPVSPLASPPTDRYGAAAALSPMMPAGPLMGDERLEPSVDEASPPTATESSPADVARGQEPVVNNPLRSGARRESPLRGGAPAQPAAAILENPARGDVNGESGEARAAFGEPTPPSTPGVTPAVARPNGGAEAPPSAVQFAGLDESRYAALPLPPSETAGQELHEPKAADPAAPATPLPTFNPFANNPPGAIGGSVPEVPSQSLEPAPRQTSPQVSDPTVEFSPALPAREAEFASAADAASSEGTGRPGDGDLEGPQTPSLSIQKLAPPEIQVGKPCVFQIRVFNGTQRTVHDVRVSDEAPLGTQLVGTLPEATIAGAQATWSFDALRPGEEQIVEMELLPTDEGEIGSVAKVTFAAQASAKTRCTRPQLALRLTAGERVMIGQQQVVKVEVSNPGSGDATGVMLLENIPEGVSHEAGPALEFEVGTLRAGETRQLDLVLTADAAGVIENIMTARADANLQAQANCKFEIIAPELKVTVDGPARRFLDRPATYTVSVNNPGTASAKDVQLVTRLPKGLQFVSANEYGEYDAETHSVFWSLPELPANEHGKVELTAMPVEPGEYTLEVATRAQQGLEDRAEARVLVEGLVALSFEVQDVDGAVEVGGETAYEIRVSNQGTKAATNVQIVAKMPQGLRPQTSQGDARFTVQGDRVVFAPLPQLAPKADVTLRFTVQGLQPGDQRLELHLTADEVRDPIVEIESTQVYAEE